MGPLLGAIAGGQGSSVTGATDSGDNAQSVSINAGGFGPGFFERETARDDRKTLLIGGAIAAGLLVLVLLLRRG